LDPATPFLGSFTKVLKDRRAGGAATLDRESLRELLDQVLVQVGKALGREIPKWSLHGQDQHEDLVNSSVVWFLERLEQEDDKDFPDKVVDSQTLLFYMSDWVCKRRYKQRLKLKGNKGQPGRRGPSAMANDPDGDSLTLGDLPSEPEIESHETQEMFRLLLDDLRAERGNDNDVNVFLARIQSDRSLEDIAAEHDISTTTAHRIVRTAELLLRWRLGWATGDVSATVCADEIIARASQRQAERLKRQKEST
jgi:hypothetical protein